MLTASHLQPIETNLLNQCEVLEDQRIILVRAVITALKEVGKEHLQSLLIETEQLRYGIRVGDM